MKHDMGYYIYFMTNDFNKVLYIGMTNNLERRLYEHRNGLLDGFTKKYKCKKLVYFESYEDSYTAISREKSLKGWVRKRKNALIDSKNPQWVDLSKTNYQYPSDSSQALPSQNDGNGKTSS